VHAAFLVVPTTKFLPLQTFYTQRTPSSYDDPMQTTGTLQHTKNSTAKEQTMDSNQSTRRTIRPDHTAAADGNGLWHTRWKKFANAATVMLAAISAHANGGPFVIKYPGGDPAAKGVLARLDPSLQPAREEQLKVIKEELTIAFGGEHRFPRLTGQSNNPALVNVQARYDIANPTDETIVMDFGFPILRGVYMNPWSMMPTPDVRVTVKADGPETNAPVKIISNSAIYGLIRSRARERIEAALEGNAALRPLVKAVRDSTGEAREQARQALAKEARRRLKWNERDMALLVEYVGLNLGTNLAARPFDAGWLWFGGDVSLQPLLNANLGPLAAIGEQKATQLLAHLASLFDPKSAADYESIFAAWGGDVRERSLDLRTGEVRPREYEAPSDAPRPGGFSRFGDDPTIYARVDYLDDKVKLSEDQKATCKTILKNLPVTFTFAPMNLLYYQVTFAPRTEQAVTVSYSQYAYRDTGVPESHQIAYVVHPASLWKEFGPIQLSVLAPPGVRAVASVPLREVGTASLKERLAQRYPLSPPTETPYVESRGEVTRKIGELLVAVDAADWRNHIAKISAERRKPNSVAADVSRRKGELGIAGPQSGQAQTPRTHVRGHTQP